MSLLEKKMDISYDFKNFFTSEIEYKTSRRSFLKCMGFGTVAVALAACKGPVIKSIPYIFKPESITIGEPTYYASTMLDGFDLSCVLVKTREGRPIKLEPNKTAKIFNKTSARVQASLLSLYDEERLKNPYIRGKRTSWKVLDNYVVEALKNISRKGKQIVILSSSYPSPSTKNLITDFSKIYTNTSLVIYDAISYSKALDASKDFWGIRALPRYELSKIELIVSFEADFLGDWSPENLGFSYARSRSPRIGMLRHIQIESNMSLSGANADLRIPVKPSEAKRILAELYKAISDSEGSKDIFAQRLAKEILSKGPNVLILADGDKESYALSLLINQKIKSNALIKNSFILSKESNDEGFKNFLYSLKRGIIGALMIFNTNPLYSFSESEWLRKAIQKIDLSIYFSEKEDETSDAVQVLAPIPHWLESWGDANPVNGIYTLIQPTIRKIFNTRQFQDSLLIWKNIKEKVLPFRNYYDYLRKFWEKKILPKSTLDSFNRALFKGWVEIPEYISINWNTRTTSNNFRTEKKGKKGFEIKLYTKIGIGDGTQGNNPLLQEFPDPITRTTWDNYMTISSHDAKKLGIKNWNVGDGSVHGHMVNLHMGSVKIENVPVYIQPGQAKGSLGLALGYGKIKGKIAQKGGRINAYRIYKNFNILQAGIKIEKSKGIHDFSCIQLQNTSVGRNSIASETDLEIFLNQPKENWNKKEKIYIYNGNITPEGVTIWSEQDSSQGHHFNISVDLNSCIGCGACVISCNVENNVPVVGKEEIRKSRDMHWLRIDRYYSTKENFESLSKKGFSEKNISSEPRMYSNLLKPDKNPSVIFQPVMCQHCNNAPCETVCPVAATSHGIQGQNMMAYNRCIGTRYCANNCPYKVRRFNWFNYAENEKFDFHMNNDFGRMVLNPEVVIRSRGVMEKCSMCVQITQTSILKAKKEGRKVKDEEFQTACSKACPTNAIRFGDINDKESEVFKELENKRSYQLLDFIGTKPNVFYQVKIRNKNNDVLL
ncbi:MAG TPA: 4Fe-4S dicluster domain-containing protein [Candidatus Angelobacter sp.]|nr:4Fe-4S dicluster domain-containing protein [Candidatus Angelobacter sp.]